MKNRKTIPLSAAALILVAAIITTGCLSVYGMGRYFNSMLGDLTQMEDRYAKLEEIDDLVEKYFVGEYDREAMMDAAAAAYVDAMGDQWSGYFTAEEYARMVDYRNNSYVGVGITVMREEEGCRITSVTAKSPAELAGVKVMDLLVAVDGKSILSMDGMDELTQMIKGESGTSVTLTLRRGGEELTLTMNRALVYYETVSAELLHNGLGHVYISAFETNTANEFRSKVETLIAQGAKGLVFDVRFNGGGLLSELTEMLDMLLPEGTIISTAYKNGDTQNYTSDAEHIDLPMAVLCNQYSISAAEFFCAALQEYGVATVVGEHTNGKGYGQVMKELSDGSALNLSVLRYFTPKGVSLAGVGIAPDLEVKLPEEAVANFYTLSYEEDTQLVAACEALLK